MKDGNITQKDLDILGNLLDQLLNQDNSDLEASKDQIKDLLGDLEDGNISQENLDILKDLLDNLDDRN